MPMPMPMPMPLPLQPSPPPAMQTPLAVSCGASVEALRALLKANGYAVNASVEQCA